MRFPLINLPVVYHIGTLDPARRGEYHTQSLEGAGLSVSLCPLAWQAIAHLGGAPLKGLCKHDAVYLDILALDSAALDAILRWALDSGLVEQREMWRAWTVDGDTDEWTFMLDDFRSLYDCVAMRVPGDPATPAVHSLASADMSADAFMRELGCGSAVGGRRMLQAVLSAHTAAGVDIASGCDVSYSASQSDGMPCLCVTKDGTEYVFQRRGLRTAPRFGTPHADLADLPVGECHDEPGFR